MNEEALKHYLATGESPVATQDAAIDSTNDPFVKSSLAYHDKRFHPKGYKEGDSCKFRERLNKGDQYDMFLDDLRVESEKEETAKEPDKSSKGDPERGRQAIIDGPGAGYLATLEKEVAEGKTEGLEKEKARCRHWIENGKDDAEKQLHRDALAFLEELGKKAEKKNIPENKIPSDAEIEEAAKATSKAFDFSEQAVKNKISDMLKGDRVFNDQNGGLLDVVQAMKGKGGVVQAIKARAKEQFIPEDHPWFDENYWDERDAELALRNKLAKSIESDYKKYDLEKKTGQTVEAFVSQFIDDAKADGFTVSEKSEDVLRQRMDGLRKMPASAPYEPRIDMYGLYSAGENDPDAKAAAKLAADFNKKAGWDFSDEDVQAYFDAFKDMDAGKFPYGLPEFEGKVNEKNFNEGDFSGESKDFQKLLGVLGSRPDLIRPYIVERLTDANFHTEAKELASGAYKNRTTPYNGDEEDAKRQGKPTQDAIDRYLKEAAKA